MLQNPLWQTELRVEVLGRDALPNLLPAWHDLLSRCAEDNVYYSPRYAEALLASVDREKLIRFAVVWAGSKLVGFLPVVKSAFPSFVRRRFNRAWQSKYTFGCMPLLDNLAPIDTASALLKALESVNPGEWVLPCMNVDGPTCRAIMAALERRGSPWALEGRFQRAVLEVEGTFDDHVKRHVSAKRRKDLERNRRRLEALGKVEHESHSFGEGLDRAVAAFLRIEASGWKGRRGTALACNARTTEFALQTFTGDRGSSICRADSLTLNGVPIAVSLAVCAGRTGFTVKCCYDETYRSYSTGLLLELDVIRSLFAERWIGRLDSATAGTHVVDGLWSGHVEVADLIFSLALRRPAWRLSIYQTVDHVMRAWKAKLKRWYLRLRGS